MAARSSTTKLGSQGPDQSWLPEMEGISKPLCGERPGMFENYYEPSTVHVDKSTRLEPRTNIPRVILKDTLRKILALEWERHPQVAEGVV
ncbi:hypothetical protein N7541_010445 [Penicillium brevicompactum]|uniref:Uncharacterized protein n=1 Tax=Penicillium brevicompactum TaxID=5074 RepID=A0A9W9QNJ3_PENBR|nr:hypothetical protein N7541_010445 [Penicillium brevicompactum]